MRNETKMSCFEAMDIVANSSYPIFVVFDNPTQFQHFSELCGLDTFQEKLNSIQFRFKCEGEKLFIGQSLG